MKKFLPCFLLAMLCCAFTASAQAPNISYPNPGIKAVTGKPITPISITNTGGAVPSILFGRTTTFAGTGRPGSANGSGSTASFNNPQGIALGTDGALYVADVNNNRIRKILADGTVNHIAGEVEGYLDNPGYYAQFKGPAYIAADALGNFYITDNGNLRLRMLDKNNNVTTLAGSGISGATDAAYTSASFTNPQGITVAADGNIYVADQRLRAITPGGNVSTVNGAAAITGTPSGVAADAAGNLYVGFGELIRKVATDGTVSIVAGSAGHNESVDGTTANAYLNNVQQLAFDANGNLFFTQGNNAIREVTSSGQVITIAGGANGNADGVGAAAKFNAPLGLAVNTDGYLFVADSKNNLIRKVATRGFTVSPALPAGLSIDSTGTISGTPVDVLASTVYTVTAYNGMGVSSTTFTLSVDARVEITAFLPHSTNKTGTVIIKGSNFSGATSVTFGGVAPASFSVDATGTVITAKMKAGMQSGDVVVTAPIGTEKAGGFIFNTDPVISYANVPQKLTAGVAITPIKVTNTGAKVPDGLYGQVSLLAGTPGLFGNKDGSTKDATFGRVTGIAMGKTGNIYISDNSSSYSLIRKISPDGHVSSIAGSYVLSSDGKTGTSQFGYLRALAADENDNLYVANAGAGKLEVISQDGSSRTLLSNLSYPLGVAIDSLGALYYSDYNNFIQKVNLSNGSRKTFGAYMAAPSQMAINTAGDMYVAVSGQTNPPSTDVVKKIAANNTTSAYGGIQAQRVSIALDNLGNVYYSQLYPIASIRRLQPDGTDEVFASRDSLKLLDKDVVRKVNAGIDTSAIGLISAEAALAYDNNGGLIVSDQERAAIKRINLTGYYTDKPLPQGLTLNADGSITGTPTESVSSATYTIYGYTAYGVGSTAITLNIEAQPEISSFSPYVANAFGEVVINGKYLKEVTSVTFGGVAVTNFTVSADGTSITAKMADGMRSGDIVLTSAKGSVKASGFIFNTAPVISYANVPQKLSAGVALTPIPVVKSGGDFTQGMYGKVSILAGSGSYGIAEGAANAATFANPMGAVADRAGNVYVADANNNKIRKIAKDGTVSTFAGTGGGGLVDGPAANAQFNYPSAIAIDPTGNLYVTDAGNNRVRKITPGGVVSTFGGDSFGYPYGITADNFGNVYVANTYTQSVSKVTPEGKVTLFASEPMPYGVAVSLTGGLYVADRKTNELAEYLGINPNSFNVKARFPTIGSNLAIDGFGTVYRSDTTSTSIFRWKQGQAVTDVTIFAGNYSNDDPKAGYSGQTRGVDTTAVLSKNAGISYDGNGNLIITDPGHSQVKKISLSGYYLDKPLPKGMVFNYSTGAISGTPVEVSAATTYTIYAYNATTVGSTTITFAVEKGQQVITWASAPTKTYGDADFDPGAISNNAGTTITYTSSDETVVKQVGDKLHIVGAGTATVTASQPKSDAFDAATPVVKTITINKAELTVTAFDLIKTFNTDNPTLYLDYKGFVNSEDDNVLTTKPTATTTATKTSAAGDYPIVPAGAAAKNYSFKYVNGTLTVFPVPVITTPGSFSFQQGGSIVLTATPSTGGYAYQWYKDAVPIPNGTQATLTVTDAASYAVSINAKSYTTFSTPVSVTTVFTLPVNNFKITITANTCKGSNNGAINITAARNLNYVASLTVNNTTTNYPFTDKLDITGLAPDIYSVCITVAGQTYLQCFSVTVTEPKDLSVYTAVNKTLNQLNLSLENGTTYNIQLNGKTYNTSNSSITLPLAAGNNRLMVTTDKPCQGVFEKMVLVSDQVMPYPSPFQDVLYLNVGESYRGNAKVVITNAVTGRQEYQKSFANCSGVLQLDVANLNNGVYVLQLSLENSTDLVYKIVKK